MFERSEDLFKKLQKAVITLNESIDLVAENTNPKLVQALKDSVIQRFEYTIELSWKFLKYYLLEEHAEDCPTSMEVIKTAYKTGLIKNLDIWIDMIKKRNRLSHDYHQEFADLTFDDIIDNIIVELNNFIIDMKKKYE